jgi:multidrug efflux pump subunit AcrA (membrane-fusion protein)
MQATVDSNAANIRRLAELQSFERIYAPFDGVITARNTDIGALINAGANAPGQELFHIAAISKLRIFVAIPEIYARAAQPGAKATLTLNAFLGEIFHGTLVRNASSINLASRTLLTEVMVGPDYIKPSVPMTPAYKEAPPAGDGWKMAQPSEEIPRGNW